MDRSFANLHLQQLQDDRRPPRRRDRAEWRRVPASSCSEAEGEGVAALEACRDRAIAALCAEAVGAMTELNSATLEYARRASSSASRSARFRCCSTAWSTCSSALEEAVSLTQHLNLSLAAGSRTARKLRFGAKTKVGYAARFIAEQAVQLHGGMGMTDELNVGHYFKRITAINVQFGDPTYHLMRYARQDQSVQASDAVARPRPARR